MTAVPPIQSFEEFEAETLALIRPFRSHFGAVSLQDLDKKGPEHEHLIKGVQTRGEVGMLVGPSGSGKSFLATHMSFVIGRGIDFDKVTVGGRSVTPRVRRGGVLYIAGEGARGLKKRLRAYLKHHGLNGSEVPFILLTKPVDLHNSEEHTNLLIEEAKGHAAAFLATYGVRLELIVLDTLSASTPGANENASDDVSRVLGRCHRIAQECECGVLLVHHMNAGGTRERGHSSLRANVDSVIEVARHETLRDADGRAVRIAKVTKQKDGEDGVTWRFVLPSVELGRDADGDPITSCVVAPPAERDESTAGEEAFTFNSDNARLLYGCLVEALKTKGEAAHANMKAPRGAAVVAVADWRAVAMQRMPTGDDDDDEPHKRRERVKRAVNRFIEKFQAPSFRLIGADLPYVWISGRSVKGFPSWIGPPDPAAADAPAADIAPASDW